MKYHLAYLSSSCHPFASIVLISCLLLQSEYGRADAYGSGWYQQLQLATAFEDNISRSVNEYDKASDTVAKVSVGVGYSEKVGTTGQFMVNGYVTYSQYAKYQDLNHIAISLGGTYVHQFGYGFQQPWMETTFQVTNFNYADSQEREGLLFEGSTRLSRRLGHRLIGSIGYRYTDVVFLGKTADYSLRNGAFDIAFHELFLDASYRLSGTTYVFAEYGFRHGGLTSNNSTLLGNYSYEVESPDHVFDRCNANGCQSRYSYRTVADTHRVDLGVAFQLWETSLDLSATYLDASAEDGPGYQDWLVQAGATWSF